MALNKQRGGYMSKITRALFDEADGAEILIEPPGHYADQAHEGETPIGTVPLDVRRTLSLAHAKAQKMIDLAKEYDCSQDVDGSKLGEIIRLEAEAEALDDNASSELWIHFLPETRRQGTIWIRSGWVVTWSPVELEEDESGEVSAQEPVLN
jgi:hypothetical protein